MENQDTWTLFAGPKVSIIHRFHSSSKAFKTFLMLIICIKFWPVAYSTCVHMIYCSIHNVRCIEMYNDISGLQLLLAFKFECPNKRTRTKLFVNPEICHNACIIFICSRHELCIVCVMSLYKIHSVGLLDGI